MKNFIKGMAMLSMLSLFSCTKTIYTQEQVLSNYQAKKDVMKRFGMPTEKKVTDSTEAWLYRFDRKDSFTRHSVDEYQNAQTIAVADLSRPKRYLIFVFDQKGNVIRYDYKGVDLAVKKKDTAATIALIAAGVGVVLGATAIVAHNAFDGYTYTP
ncbi:MAG TPA: hypothetical protein VK671_12525 [Mucilaginibacter sp.]|jgi:hypothetical protein|nr:hypothetical protein [Mucilaginibacter sp.]